MNGTDLNAITKEGFLSWLYGLPDGEVIGVGPHRMFAGPLAHWLYTLGYSGIIVSREDVLVLDRGKMVDLEPAGWMQVVMAAEDLLKNREEITVDEFQNTLDSLAGW